jgi:pilus assembly protein CpaE
MASLMLSSQDRVFAFLSCKGGVGTTFLTTQLGSILAMRQNLKVLIVDLAHPFGDAALMLSQSPPPATLSDLIRQPDRLDEALLQSALVFPQPRLGILAAADNPTAWTQVEPHAIRALMEVARQCFDCILLDCGRGLDDVRLAALDSTDKLLPVLQSTMPMLRDGRRLLTALAELGFRAHQVMPLINRRGHALLPSTALLPTALSMSQAHSIPDDGAFVQACIDTGLPAVARSPHHPITRSLIHLAERLVHEPGADLPPSSGIVSHWLRKQWRWAVHPQPIGHMARLSL